MEEQEYEFDKTLSDVVLWGKTLTYKLALICDTDGETVLHNLIVNDRKLKNVKRFIDSLSEQNQKNIELIMEGSGTKYCVAHALYNAGKLPVWWWDFSLTDSNGNTLAHVIANKGYDSPRISMFKEKDFALVNKDGVTVREVMRSVVNSRIESLKEILKNHG